jgi:predicted anti-sigma-YlaC factor YlaD
VQAWTALGLEPDAQTAGIMTPSPRTTLSPLLIAAIVILVSGCSVSKTTMNFVAGALSREGNSSVFSGDDDPELVGDAMPFAIKLYESLLASCPRNPSLLLATGKSLCMYSYAFVQVPAEQMSYNELQEKDEMLQRAKHLYLRGRDDVLKAITLRHPHFAENLNKGNFKAAFRGISVRDTSYLYWAGMSWMAAFTADKSDVGLTVDIPKAVACVQKVMDLNDSYSEGAAHEFFISYYGAMPAAMGGSEAKAREQFALALKCSKGAKIGPYLDLATTVCIKSQNLSEFKTLLETALKINVNKSENNRLVNILNQQKARWFLDHTDDFFLPAEGDSVQ